MWILSGSHPVPNSPRLGHNMGATALNPIPILTYHSLDESGSVISLPPAVFRHQIEALKEWGYVGVSLKQLLDGWCGGHLPARPVVLTFDDAFANFADHAAPLLRQVGFRATLFAVAGYCGERNDWPTQPATIPRMPLLSLADLRDLIDSGFEIGAHTMTHPVLTALSPERAEWEIAAARATLEDGLGHEVATFAYPYGRASRANRASAADHYRAACGVRLGVAHRGRDRYCLPRIDMYYYRDPRLFRLFPFRVGSAYLAVRTFGRACRAFLGTR